MKRKFLLFLSVMLVALMPLCASATVVRVVKSTVPENWGGTVYIHYWDGSNGSDWNNCPAMEADGDYLKYDIGNNPKFLLKNQPGQTNNNFHQTGDVNITSDAIYEFKGGDAIVVVTEGEDVITYAIHGNFTDSNWSSFNLEGDGDVLSVKITPTTGASGEFGLRVFTNGSQLDDGWIGGNASISEANPTVTLSPVSDDSKWNLTQGKEYTFTYTVSSKTLSISWEEVEKDPIYIIGHIAESNGNFDPSKCHPLTNIKGTNKYYTTNLKVLSGGQFGLTTKLGSSSGDWGSIDGYRYKFIANGDKKYTLEADNYETTNIGEGTYYIVVDMDAKTAEIGDAAEINAPEALYMYGNFYDRHFDFSDPVIAVGEKLGEEDYTTYKFENILICGATEDGDTGYFILGAGVAPANNAALLAATEPERVAPENVDWTGIDGTHRYVLGENNVVTPLVANAHPTTAEYCTSTAAGNYVDLTVKLAADGSHTYEMTEHGYVATGVEAIEAEANAPVEYYNLQGVRVANPENGIFIRRQGNKVSKVAIR